MNRRHVHNLHKTPLWAGVLVSLVIIVVQVMISQLVNAQTSNCKMSLVGENHGSSAGDPIWSQNLEQQIYLNTNNCSKDSAVTITHLYDNLVVNVETTVYKTKFDSSNISIAIKPLSKNDRRIMDYCPAETDIQTQTEYYVCKYRMRVLVYGAGVGDSYTLSKSIRYKVSDISTASPATIYPVSKVFDESPAGTNVGPNPPAPTNCKIVQSGSNVNSPNQTPLYYPGLVISVAHTFANCDIGTDISANIFYKNNLVLSGIKIGKINQASGELFVNIDPKVGAFLQNASHCDSLNNGFIECPIRTEVYLDKGQTAIANSTSNTKMQINIASIPEQSGTFDITAKPRLSAPAPVNPSSTPSAGGGGATQGQNVNQSNQQNQGQGQVQSQQSGEPSQNSVKSSNVALSVFPNPLKDAGIESVSDIIVKVAEVIAQFGIPLVVLAIIYSGALYVFAHGNSSKIKSANQTLMYTIIGAVLLLASYTIAKLVASTAQGLGGM